MSRLNDLAGRRFGQLLVLERAPNRPHRTNAQWLCKCDCGTSWTVGGHHLVSGVTAKCKRCARVPLEGQRFGRLLVIGSAPRESRKATKARWLCRCDCGNVVNTRTDYLRSGRSTSCGCYSNSARKGPGYASWTQVVAKLRACAARRGRKIGWHLTREDVVEITSNPCQYCGAPPSQTRSVKSRPQDAVKFNGLDRVDSAGEYTRDNVVACCRHCNFAKNTMSVEDFRSWIRRVYHYFGIAEASALTSK